MGISIGAHNTTNVTNITQNFMGHGCGSAARELAQQQALLDGVMNSDLSQSGKSELLDVLKENGIIVFSGFYTYDLADITDEGARSGLRFMNSKERDTWQAARFVKTGG